MASLKNTPKHLIAEWERHADMFAFPLTCQYNGLAALRVARMASEFYHFPMPEVVVNRKRAEESTCLGWTKAGNLGACKITMRGGFSAGEFIHELAHAWIFYAYGEHDHGETFIYYMDRLCDWFRLEEQAQAAFFP